MAGRKAKPEHKRRAQRTTFVSLKTERKRFDAAADACELDLSEWIRSVLMAECDRLEIPMPEPEPAPPAAASRKPKASRKTAQ
jgi:hypothetical protein